jgi:hypothetical protein
MSCFLPTIVRDSPQGADEIPGDGLDGGKVVHVRLVVPGEFELAVVHRARDLEQMRLPVSRVVVLAQ